MTTAQARLTGYTTALILLLILAAPALARRGGMQATTEVQKGTRLIVEHVSGTLLVQGWDRDEVEIDANFDDDEIEVDARSRGSRYIVEVAPIRGLKGEADLELHVPRWMKVNVEGHQVDVEINDMESEIDVELVGGDIFVEGGRGSVVLSTVHGSIRVRDAVAELALDSTSEDIEVRDSKGRITAESVNGDVRMEGVQSSSIHIVTTNGDVLLDAGLEPEGSYSIGTHSGDVSVSISPDSDLTVTIDAYQGEVESNLDAKLEELRRNKRYQLVVGGGQGRVSIESFGGRVMLYDPKLGRRKRG